MEQLFGERVRELRLERDLSQRELAERLVGLNLDPTAITRIEKGRRALRLGEALAIAAALDTSVERILNEIGDPAARARDLRERADKDMRDAEFHMWGFLRTLQLVRNALRTSPHAVPGTDPDNYYQWVLSRVRRNKEKAGLSDRVHLYESVEKDAETLQTIANTLISDLLIVGEEPPWEEEGEEDGEHSEEA
jgi:transcriptional regulator with XRE-family HTH domain